MYIYINNIYYIAYIYIHNPQKDTNDHTTQSTHTHTCKHQKN